MTPAEQPRVEVSVKDGIVVLTVPPGGALYPEGKVFRIRNFTPTDVILLPNGEVQFPNDDGITAEALLAMTPEQISAMQPQFVEAVIVLGELEAKKERLSQLITKMTPQNSGPIYLQYATLGKYIHTDTDGEYFPTWNHVRLPIFAHEGLEFHGPSDQTTYYAMVVDDHGKFLYTPNGILYKRVV